ncbi:MAG: phenylalanine--tRNA ligase subunit alpha [Gammaproteobacteria bacterium]|nr:phenylalanine--tRNA ligase subunit alpha [Gammaproteobacteria bacterium]
MNTNITNLLKEAQQSIDQSKDLNILDQVRVTFLGKKGKITELLKQLGTLPEAKRKSEGQVINQAKEQIQSWLEQRKSQLETQELNKKLREERIDVTLPGRRNVIGSCHPVTQVQDRLVDILSTMGFVLARGPEVEDDYHNFEALNFLPNHPARTMHDTFYFPDGRLLRTHTSTVQIRYMENHTPPIRIIVPGKTYRCDSDATHSPMFHQIECLVVDESVSFANLKHLVALFLRRFFDRDDLETRFRPSYFPFTEPSAEVDAKFMGTDRWLEMGGCGMVHPNVLRFGNIDPEKYTGYAFGFGLDRLAMLYFGVNDLRLFFENDIRFLEQF